VLEKALAGLINYLVHIRPGVMQQVQKTAEDEGIDSDYSAVTDLATIIDTALLKVTTHRLFFLCFPCFFFFVNNLSPLQAYIKTNNDDITTLVANPNRCHIKYHTIVLSSGLIRSFFV